MSENTQSIPSILSAEFFAAKECAFLAVPCQCGLKAADSLVIEGGRVHAVSNGRALSLAFPDLDDTVRAGLSALAQLGQKLAVGEFAVTGVADAYFLRVIVK